MRYDDARFDRRARIETSGAIEPAALTVVGDDASAGFTYVAEPVRVARWWLRELPDDVHEWTFVDMGSGKGRVLALAAGRGFGTVVGVEFAVELHEVAVRNARAAAERGLVFEARLQDAATFAFPEGPLVVHFNNPFDESVMSRVIANLSAAYEGRPRPILVVYQQLANEEGRHSTANLELIARIPFLSSRLLEPRGWIDRRLLSPFAVCIAESPEAMAIDDSHA